MSREHKTPLTREQESMRRPVLELHQALLHLHKTLIDSERSVYEKEVGPIRSSNHFFQLLTTDPWFAWLRPISQLIVAIDETLEARDPLTNHNIDAVMNQAVFLLVPALNSDDFGKRYIAALQRDPRVVLAHAQVAKRIGSRKPLN